MSERVLAICSSFHVRAAFSLLYFLKKRWAFSEGGQMGFQGDSDRGRVRLIVIGDRHRVVTAFHLMHVSGEQFAPDPVSFRLLGFLRLPLQDFDFLFVFCDLVFQFADQVLGLLPHPVPFRPSGEDRFQAPADGGEEVLCPSR